MSTTVTFLILYLIPVLAGSATMGAYLLAYGKSLDSPIINLTLYVVILSFIVSSALTVKLIAQFLSSEVAYWGIFFAILAWLLAILPIALYYIIFK